MGRQYIWDVFVSFGSFFVFVLRCWARCGLIINGENYILKIYMHGGMGSMHRKTFVLMEKLVSEDVEEDSTVLSLIP